MHNLSGSVLQCLISSGSMHRDFPRNTSDSLYLWHHNDGSPDPKSVQSVYKATLSALPPNHRCCIKLPCFIRMAAFNGYGIYISGICGIGYFWSGNTLYHFSLQTYHKMTADFVVLRCRKIFKIIPVGYGSRSRIGRIMNGYIIYLFDRNLWSGIGIRCQKLHINKRCSFLPAIVPVRHFRWHSRIFLPVRTEFHSVPCASQKMRILTHTQQKQRSQWYISAQSSVGSWSGSFFSETSFFFWKTRRKFSLRKQAARYGTAGWLFTGLTFFSFYYSSTL